MLKVVGSILVVLGVCLLLWWSWQSVAVSINGERAVAVCTEIKTTRMVRQSRDYTTYYFAYTDKSGTKQNAKIRYGSFWLNPAQGESVPILYDPSFPGTVFYDSWIHVWLNPVIAVSVLGFLWIAQRFGFNRSSQNS